VCPSRPALFGAKTFRPSRYALEQGHLLKLVDEGRYQELVTLSEADPDANDTAQLVQGVVTETNTDEPILIREGTTAWASSQPKDSNASTDNGKADQSLGTAEEGAGTRVAPSVGPALPRRGNMGPAAAAAPSNPRVTWLPNERDWWDRGGRR
jgi:hypothetical protein